MNMLATIKPKSEQLNADDLIGRTMVITVREVRFPGGPEQPVSVFFDGDDGKPFRPCKSMRRVLVQVWGDDANAYIGKSMKLYQDPDVQYGGLKVGGIRISEMSHMDKPRTLMLTATKQTRKPHTVKPLKVEAPPPAKVPVDQAAAPDSLRRDDAMPPATDKQADATATLIARISSCVDQDALDDIAGDAKISLWRGKLDGQRPELADQIRQAFTARFRAFEASGAAPPAMDEPPPYEPDAQDAAA